MRLSGSAGPLSILPGGLVYAADMEGPRAFPGRMIAEKLADAFQDSGLQRPSS